MSLEPWAERWRDGRIGFHLEHVHPWLVQFESCLRGERPGRVLVPLCGKSLDLLWLADRGYEVHGVEGVAEAIESFHREHQLAPTMERTAKGERYLSRVTVHRADFFELGPEELGQFDAIWDRAACIAIEPRDRGRYAQQLHALLRPGGRILLVTVAMKPAANGPPFSIGDEEVHEHFRAFDIETLVSEEVLDANPTFKERGVSSMLESAWCCTRVD